jgi:hypothetical protein
MTSQLQTSFRPFHPVALEWSEGSDRVGKRVVGREDEREIRREGNKREE